MRRAAFALILLAAGAAASAAPTLEEAVARHAAAQGGLARLQALRSYHARGRITMSGFPVAGTVETWFARPCDLRQSVDLGIFRATLGAEDGVPWMTDANGQITAKRDSATVASTALSCLTQSFDYLLPGAALELCEAESSRVCLRVRGPRGGSLDLVLDPTTWLIVASRGEEQGREVVSTYRDYRMVQGIPVAFVSEQSVPSVGQTMTVTVESAAFDEPLPDSLFAIPRPAARDLGFPAGVGRVSAPVLYADNLLFTEVSVAGGPPVLFVIDSGAGATVLDSAFAESLGVRGEASVPGMGGGGVRPATLATLPRLEVAGLALEPQTGAVLPLASMIETIADLRARGILGFDFLSHFVTRIDYAAGRVTFWDPDSFAASTAAGATVEAPLANNLFSLPAAIDRGCAGTFLLDTGAASSLLSRAFAARCGLLERAGVTTSAYGIAGEERSRLMRLDSLTVAGSTIPRPAVGVQLESGSAFLTGPLAGLRGNNVLERFALTLDYRRQRVTFEKGPYFDHPRPPDRSGVVLGRDARRRVIVRGVAVGSPAARAGVRVGDVVETIDGRPVADWGPLYRVREVFRGETGRTVRLLIARGSERREVRVGLADYF
jgi:predicted aspartyl protease